MRMAARRPADPALLAHAANVAADLGADIVKLPFTGSPLTMREVVAASPIPVVTAGGGVLGQPFAPAEQ